MLLFLCLQSRDELDPGFSEFKPKFYGISNESSLDNTLEFIHKWIKKNRPKKN
jgi:hypothetical protein